MEEYYCCCGISPVCSVGPRTQHRNGGLGLHSGGLCRCLWSPPMRLCASRRPVSAAGAHQPNAHLPPPPLTEKGTAFGAGR